MREVPTRGDRGGTSSELFDFHCEGLLAFADTLLSSERLSDGFGNDGKRARVVSLIQHDPKSKIAHTRCIWVGREQEPEFHTNCKLEVMHIPLLCSAICMCMHVVSKKELTSRMSVVDRRLQTKKSGNSINSQSSASLQPSCAHSVEVAHHTGPNFGVCISVPTR